MPQTVKCPRCGKELIAPDELIGKVAACPQCHEPIPITGSIRGSTPPSTTNSPTMATVATNLPPTAAPTAAVLPPPPDVRRSNPILATMPVTAPPEPRSAQPVAVVIANSAPAQLAGPRLATTARFITADPTDTRINLGADGRLPELRLDESQDIDRAATPVRSANPLILVGVLGVSFVMSAVLLFLDTETRKSESQRRADARRELEVNYTQSSKGLEKYQAELRSALQSHNRRKYDEERKHYRRVIQMLRAEDVDPLKGLTGIRRGEAPPSDEHLESLLSELLKSE